MMDVDPYGEQEPSQGDSCRDMPCFASRRARDRFANASLTWPRVVARISARSASAMRCIAAISSRIRSCLLRAKIGSVAPIMRLPMRSVLRSPGIGLKREP